MTQEKLFRSFSSVFFLLLFPGFYFYHLAVASGFIPLVLGGFILPVSLVAVVLYLPLIKFILHSCKMRPVYSFLIVSLFVWCNVNALSVFFIESSGYESKAIIQHFSVMLAWVALLFVGLGLSFEERWFRCAIYISGLAIFFHLYFYVISSGEVQYIASRYYEVDSGVATHQAFARSALIVSFSLLSIVVAVKKQVLFFLVCTSLLFILSARSEFLVFVVAFSFYFLVRLKWQKRGLLGAFFAAFFLLVVGAYNSEMLMETRQANLLDIASDQSWLARKKLMSDAVDRIGQSPFVGQFGGHFESGGAGSYAHNILSAWDSYGFFAFLLYFFVVLFPLVCSGIMIYKNKHPSKIQCFMFFVSLSSLVLLLGAKTVFWPIPALAWGLCLNKKTFGDR